LADDLLDRLVAIVREHYASNDAPPLLLSRFGQSNKALLQEIKVEYGTLLNAVRAAGEERLRLVDDRVGRESIAPAEIAPAVELEIREQSANQRQGSSSFDSLPVPVRIAFCVRTEGGEYVAVRIAPPFRYEKIPDLALLRPGYRPLPDRYRKPGLVLHSASLHDREALWRSFVAWTEEEGIDPAAFKAGAQTNALARLLAAQPADVLSRLVIPADIATLLLKRP
jgi:hypothetical protein